MRSSTTDRILTPKMKETKKIFQSFKPNETNTGLLSFPASLVMASIATATSALNNYSDHHTKSQQGQD